MTDFVALIDGYRRFRTSDWARQRDRWAELRESQSPKVMVIACSDSRVDPATIFDTSPGEMFAVTQLEVPEIVVLGHGGCGGIAAALSRRFDGCAPGEGGFIAHWIDLLDEARDRVIASHGHGATGVLEHEGIKVSLANLRSFACVREREKAGKLTLHGAFFAIEDGILHVLDEARGTFAPA
jgi:carbonic anhydrase